MNTIRAHKGTDYAAPSGTPIQATSDGRVTRASRYGSFGNLVIIKHTGGFETKYAHLSQFVRGLNRGDRVRQGDIIGFVGATGGATGPHLHYEFLVNGVDQNPRTILDKLPKAKSIDPSEIDRFHQQTAGLLQQFEKLNTSRMLTINPALTKVSDVSNSDLFIGLISGTSIDGVDAALAVSYTHLTLPTKA